MSFEVGFSKVDITAYEPGMIMLGWAAPKNRVEGVGMPLHARACVVRGDAGGAFVYACADICFITLAVRQGVLRRLRAEHPDRHLGEHNVMLTATHTHSGPSGFSHYIFYNAMSFGFSRVVYEAIVDGLVTAICEADDRRAPASLRVGAAEAPLDAPVAFSRSLAAYNANVDVESVAATAPERAVDRTMTLLRADDDRGRTLGVVSWFGVHPTNVHSDNTLLHPDNKGVASALYEEQAIRDARFAPGFVAIFGQAALGDVSPNFRWHPGRGRRIGADDDDFRAAEVNGRIQLALAQRAWRAAGSSAPLSDRIGGRVEHHDMSDVELEPVDAGDTRARTRPARFGLGMAEGTDEGPGPMHGVRWVHEGLKRLHTIYQPDDAQVPLVDLGHGFRGRFLGRLSVQSGFELGRFDRGIDYLRATYVAGTMGSHPWTPKILPLQVCRIGALVIAGVPAEPTTVAGRRLSRVLAAQLEGVEHLVVNGCANAYTSYVTTREEYRLQRYEGASTHFGPHTLGAYQTLFRALVRRSLEPGWDASVEGPTPPWFTVDEMEARRDSAAHIKSAPRRFAALLGAS